MEQQLPNIACITNRRMTNTTRKQGSLSKSLADLMSLWSLILNLGLVPQLKKCTTQIVLKGILKLIMQGSLNISVGIEENLAIILKNRT